MRSGFKVEDPWQPGIELRPAEPAGPNFGALSYFWPHELLMAIEAGQENEVVDVTILRTRPLVIAICFLLLLPVGILIIILGIDDLSEDLGASVSPLGLMLCGICLVAIWFNGLRVTAAQELIRNKV